MIASVVTRQRRSAFLLALLLAAGRSPARTTVPPVAAPVVPAPVLSPLPGDLLGATVHRLANGLTIYLSPSTRVPRVTAWVAVRTGSRNDPADCTGLAHYLEHMLFKGTSRIGTMDWEQEKPHLDRIVALYDRRFKSRDGKERDRLLKEIDRENAAGAAFEVPNELDRLYARLGFDDVNAFTMDEGTVFVCSFPRNRAAVWAKVEADRFTHAVFRLFPTELETVYEEKNRAMDNPERALDEAFALALFPRHPYGTQPTLGTVAHLKNPSLARMYDYFHKAYVPANMCIALAGDFDRAEMLALLEREFGGWESRPVPPRPAFPTPRPKGTKRVAVTFEAEEKVVIGWQAVPGSDPDADIVTVMDMLMDNAVAGIINLSLVQAQKVKAAGSSPDLNRDAGIWEVWAVPRQGQTPAQAEALLLGAVERLKRGEFEESDLKAVITNFEVGEKRELESNEARVNRMAMSFVAVDEWAHAAGRLDRLRRVTKADVVRVANALLGADRVVAVRHHGKPNSPVIPKPSFTRIQVEDVRQSAFFGELVALPAPPIEPRWVQAGRDVSVSNRPFGRLYAGPNPENDVFDLAFIFPIGTRQEKELGAALDLLDLAGTGTLDGDAFRKALYALGTTVSLAEGERRTTVSLSGLESHLEESLRLVLERFAHPAVAPGTLEKMVAVQLGSHQDNKKNPSAVFAALVQFAERGPDSSVLNQVSDAGLKALTEPRLTALGASLWDLPRAVVYVGTRSPDEIALRVAVAPAPHRVAPPTPRMAYLVPAAPRVLVTHRDMVQSRVFLYAPDGPMDPARAVDEDVWTHYMGGSMSSVLFQEIRETRALAYVAGGGVDAGDLKGDDSRLWGNLGCQADKTMEAAGLLATLEHHLPLSATRLGESLHALDEAYRTAPLQFRAVPGMVMAWEEQGLPPGDPRPARFARLQHYTLDDLAAFSRRYSGVPFTLAILGHRDRLDLHGLAALGTVQEVPLDSLFPY